MAYQLRSIRATKSRLMRVRHENPDSDMECVRLQRFSERVGGFEMEALVRFPFDFERQRLGAATCGF